MADSPQNTSPPVPAGATVAGGPGKQAQVRIQEIAGFEILGKIGQGGMGAVYKARQKSLDRIVALKILPPNIAKDAKFIERFQREARASARLNHPNIVLGIDVGQDKGVWFFAMEMVDGPSLKALLAQSGKIPQARALEIMRDVARALECVAANGMVHRDIKPDNILLTLRGDAKLADLGLAKHAKDDASLTQAGQAVGTPNYMAPEQARGEVDSLDIRTDFYALGASFFHVLTGFPPFSASTSAAIMVKHLTEPPPKAHKVNPEISESLGKLLEKLMQKKKEQRVQTPALLLEEIERIVKEDAAKAKAASHAQVDEKTGPRAAVRSAQKTAASGRLRDRAGRQAGEKGSSAIVAGVIGVVALVALIGFFARSGGTASQPAPVPAPTIAQAAAPPAPQARPAPSASKLETPAKATPPNPNPPEAVQPDTPPNPPLDPAQHAPGIPAPAQPATDPKTVDPLAQPQPAEVAQPQPQPAAAAQPAGPTPQQQNMARAKFLLEMCKRTRAMDLPKLEKDLQELAAQPEFAPAKDQIAEDLKDLAQAVRFEQGALETMGQKKPTLDLPDNHPLRKLGAAKVKIESYDRAKGLYISASGVGMALSARDVPPPKVVEIVTPRADDFEAANYFLSRGALQDARDRLAALKDEPRARLEEKLKLLKEGEAELSAAASYAAIASLTKASQAKQLLEKIAVFEGLHGNTNVARMRAGELAACKEFAEVSLNPLRGVFHAPVVRTLPDGFVEVAYDFSSPAQLQDFACDLGDLSLENGYLKVPRAGGEEYAGARFLAPILELRKFEVAGKTLTGDMDITQRFGIYFFPPGATTGRSAPTVLCRIYNKSPHLENWAGNNRNLIGNPVDWTKDLLFAASDDGNRALAWTVDKAKLGTVTMPSSAVGGNIILAGTDGNHAWKGFKIVFKPDPAWVKRRQGN